MNCSALPSLSLLSTLALTCAAVTAGNFKPTDWRREPGRLVAVDVVGVVVVVVVVVDGTVFSVGLGSK